MPMRYRRQQGCWLVDVNGLHRFLMAAGGFGRLVDVCRVSHFRNTLHQIMNATREPFSLGPSASARARWARQRIASGHTARFGQAPIIGTTPGSAAAAHSATLRLEFSSVPGRTRSRKDPLTTVLYRSSSAAYALPSERRYAPAAEPAGACRNQRVDDRETRNPVGNRSRLQSW